MIDAYEVILVS